MYYSSPSELVDELNKAIDDAVGNILKYLDIIQYSSYTSDEDALHQYTTELDQKQLALQKEEIVSNVLVLTVFLLPNISPNNSPFLYNISLVLVWYIRQIVKNNLQV